MGYLDLLCALVRWKDGRGFVRSVRFVLKPLTTITEVPDSIIYSSL